MKSSKDSSPKHTALIFTSLFMGLNICSMTNYSLYYTKLSVFNHYWVTISIFIITLLVNYLYFFYFTNVKRIDFKNGIYSVVIIIYMISTLYLHFLSMHFVGTISK